MGREVRMVPLGWEHPKDARGNYAPLLIGPYALRAAEWEEAAKKWDEGLVEDYAAWSTDNGQIAWKPKDARHLRSASYADYAGEAPREEDYMPAFEPGSATHLMMYENVSEGTPISPAFPTPEELAQWLVTNDGYSNATYEQWLRVAKGGYAPSMVMDARGLRSGVAL